MELLTGRMIYESHLPPGLTGWRESENRAGKDITGGGGVSTVSYGAADSLPGWAGASFIDGGGASEG